MKTDSKSKGTWLHRFAIRLSLALLALWGGAAAQAAPALDDFLRDGKLREGLKAYAAPTNNAERFSLAVLQALDGFQQFSTGFNQLGFNPEISRELARSRLPFLRMAKPNGKPGSRGVVTPEKIARLFGDLKEALRRANATLAAVNEEPFGVNVNWSQARLDLDGDGSVATNELLLVSLGRNFGLAARGPADEDLVIRFDSADAVWLKGYTHFLMGLLDVLTAYDWMPVWNQCAHRIFCNPKPLPPIAQYSDHAKTGRGFDEALMADLIAALHEMRLEPIQKDGLRKARDEFRAMIACSRVCWQRVLAETDNDHEWLPSPTQTGPRGAEITAEQIEGWRQVLD
jgi:hypothetical protein